jgi:hypothetical protein
MKAEHRKELQTNALADRLGRLMHGFRHGFEIHPSQKAWLVGGGIVAAIALGVGVWMYFGWVSRTKSVEWIQLDEASSLRDVEQIADKNPNGAASRAARFQLARVYLKRGMENFCSSSPDGRKEAMHDLEEAGRLYGELASESKDTPVLAQEALLGVGKAKEASNELEAALSAYQDLAKRYPNSVSGKEAAERVKKLTENKDQVSAFYQELDKLANPPPVAPTPKKE